jgi:hypothetical protein
MFSSVILGTSPIPIRHILIPHTVWSIDTVKVPPKTASVGVRVGEINRPYNRQFFLKAF